MDRRSFVAAAGTAALAAGVAHGQADLLDRDIYELRRYTLKAGERQAGFDAYLKEALLPALDRIGVGPVGVFKPATEGAEPVVYLLAVHAAPETLALASMLVGEETFAKAAAPYLDLPPTDPLYTRVESSLMLAFAGMKQAELPKRDATRVFQLRIYESHNERSAAKKIEMFNTAEIGIFRRVGLNPVFFGQTLAGAVMPNLTYMVGFASPEAQREAWNKFRVDPEWKALSGKPEYSDKLIVSRITNVQLLPTDYSRI